MVQIIGLFALIAVSHGLTITNTTPPINLTRTFFPLDAPYVTDSIPGSMTYYIDPTDSTKQKYLYLGFWGVTNKSNMISSYIESDIFTQDFAEYNNNNNINDSLPFVLSNATEYGNSTQLEAVGYHASCTSPITNDILSCWIHALSPISNVYNYAISCKIFMSTTSTWSNEIPITNVVLGAALAQDVLCFDDSYFIPFIEFHEVLNNYRFYGTFIDLQGNVIHNKFSLNIQLSQFGSIFASKGGESLDPSQVNSDATDLAILYYADLYENPDGGNQTIIKGLYMYYTNITDSQQFPLYNYSEVVLNQNDISGNDFILGSDSKSINYTSDCCFVTVYSPYDPSNGISTYAAFTDIYGEHIDIDNYPDDEDILLRSDVSFASFVNNQIIDLSVISTENTHYFLVLFSTSDQFLASGIMAGVYYLEYDDSESVYTLNNNGYFNLSKVSDEYYMDTICCYLMPQQTDLYCSWQQENTDYIGSFFGQVFSIN